MDIEAEVKKQTELLETLQDKVKDLESNLREDQFEDPVARTQKETLDFLLEFRNTFHSELLELEKHRSNTTDVKETGKEDSSKREQELDKLVGRLNYRILHLTQSYYATDKEKDDEILKLRTESNKQKYRIKHLLKHINS